MNRVSRIILFALSFLGGFTWLMSCQSNKNTTPQFGETDPLAIASDTNTQLIIESSYEYHNTLAANHNEVYDIVGYGAPAKGSIAIIYRNNKGVKDTVAQVERRGIIQESRMTDLNANRKPEIMLVLQSYDTLQCRSLIGFEMNQEKPATPLAEAIDLKKKYGASYQGKDTIFYDEGRKTVYQEFLLRGEDGTTKKMRISYKLKGEKIEAEDIVPQQE